MRVFRGNKRPSSLRQPVIATIGMFDGVHLAHQRLIRAAVGAARRRRGTSVAVTFHPDPRRVLDPTRAPIPLLPLEERLRHIEALGTDAAWVIPFTKAFARLTPAAFVRRIVVERLRACAVVVGQNFRFGRGRHGDIALLRVLGARDGVAVRVIPPVRRDGQPISSSRIRRLVRRGRLRQAQRLLGHPLAMTGRVVRGAGRGRGLGIPTANLRVTSPWHPPPGVYAVWFESAARRFRGAMNVGRRPTFLPATTDAGQAGGAGPLVCEVHLLDVRPRLYGQSVRVQLITRLRGERRFRSPTQLVRQIQRDIRRARRVLASV